MEKYFERTLYDTLVKWAEKSDFALYLKGPRQAGKTSLLRKLGEEEFENFVYIALNDDGDREKFERLHTESYNLFDRNGGFEDSHGERFTWIFKQFNRAYENNRQNLVIIDEIQESPKVYKLIRQIRRSLKSKLAVSGSYLGVTAFSSKYWNSVGDIETEELSTFSYIEFLRANGIYEEYDKINNFDLTRLTDDEKQIYKKAEELYNIYCQIGGYPKVVQKWTESGDINECRRIISEIIDGFYEESIRHIDRLVDLDGSKQILNIFGADDIKITLDRLAQAIVLRNKELSEDTGIEALGELRGIDAKGAEIRRREKLQVLNWLRVCHLVGTVETYYRLTPYPDKNDVFVYPFNDLGILNYFCSASPIISPSNYNGALAENFVYLYLLTQQKIIFAEKYITCYKGADGQIDFVLHDKERNRWGFEVKSGSGSVKSGDAALKDGRLDYLIKFQNTFGFIGEKTATIPIFAADKLKYVF